MDASKQDIPTRERKPTPFELWQIALEYRRQTERIEDEILACDTLRDRDLDRSPVPRAHVISDIPLVRWHFSVQMRDVA